MCAEMVASTLLCPYERARIRLVAQPDYAPHLMYALHRLVNEHGVIGGLFGDGGSALAPTLLKMVSYTTTQLTVFQLLLDYVKGKSWSSGYPRIAITLPSAIVAAICATLASQCGDALQTRASQAAKSGEEAKSIFENARELGCAGMWIGWNTRIVMFSCMIVIQLMTYDGLRVAFGLTG
eukprot:TRINITY_DN9557_c0_g1_i1.p2 TRINITY_DN9557_c0_g1~~TRINITY_DN9557_c0_g1_i1.p2  ORF type:complete len:180 (+),score=28.25 TRINITY_DN9557_c0_g1_i1:579-1118(+)